jgi:hypothetical protein
MDTGSFPGVENGWGVMLNPHPILVLRSKKQSRVIPLFSLTAFVACKKGETYLHITDKKLKTKQTHQKLHSFPDAQRRWQHYIAHRPLSTNLTLSFSSFISMQNNIGDAYNR